MWIQPDQLPSSGTFDWSRYMRTATPIGAPAFSVDCVPFDGVDDRIIVEDAINPAAMSATGFTVFVVFRCPAPLAADRFFFSLRADNGEIFTDCSIGDSGSIRGRCASAAVDGDATTPTAGGTVLPGAGDFPFEATVEYLAAIRWDPGAGGTFRVSLVRAGDDEAQVAASTAVQTGRGAPTANESDLYIGCQGDGQPGACGAWQLLRSACVNRALTDAELAEVVPSPGATLSFIQLSVSPEKGFVDHADPARLDPSRFQDAVREALVRNVHIVVGPGESHCGSGALTSGTAPGIDNVLNHACGRAVGLAGCGLGSFDVLPLTPALFSSVHHLPFSMSPLAGAWAASNGTIEPTIGPWDALGNPLIRQSVAQPGPRSTHHMQQLAMVPATMSTVGIAAITGLANLWAISSDRLDMLTLYTNSNNATGTYRIAGLVSGGSYNSVNDWTLNGPAFVPASGSTIEARRFPLDPTWDGVAIENIGGAGQGVRLGFFDVRSPDPGIRIGCNSLAIGGGRITQTHKDVWFRVIELAEIDYLGMCVSYSNDSGRITPLSWWWHDAQTLIRTSVAMGGPDSAGGTARTHGVWIPVEGNMVEAQRTHQRKMVNLVASLAVELDIDLVSFPAFVPTYQSGATDLYDGVHLGALKFGEVASMFEANVMPWDVADPTGACCFACTEVSAPCPSPAQIGPACVDGVTNPECDESLGGVYRGDGSACGSGPNGAPCACVADVSGDGRTNINDFSVLAIGFNTGAPDCRSRSEGDLNCDGVVNILDFNILASNFGCE